MTLRELQSLFVRLVAKLIDWAYTSGYELTFSEAYRSPQEAAINASTGTGITNSLHCQRLAIDFNLFKDGVLLGSVADFAPLGTYWKTLSELARWGGDFKTHPDSDHFSLTYGGVE
jgi:hypothetical protein